MPSQGFLAQKNATECDQAALKKKWDFSKLEMGYSTRLCVKLSQSELYQGALIMYLILNQAFNNA